MSNTGNILLVANWESNVGYAWWLMENFWVTISKHFSPEGKTSYLIYPKITELPESVRSSEIQVLQHDFKERTIRNLIRLRKIIRDHDIRFLYLTDYPSYSPYYVLLKVLGIRKIVIHDHTPGDRTVPSSWKRLLKRITQSLPLLTADHFIAVTDFVYRRFLEVHCIPPHKCSCAPNGIVPIELEGADPKYAHHCFDIPEDRLIIVMTGRASYFKGVDFFIECANELVNEKGLNHLHFLFCGDGPDLSDFKAFVRRSNLESHFTFAGRRSDVRKILPSCHVGFHPAIGEVGYSLSMLEYMSAGLVTVAPDSPSTSLAIANMKTGVLYTPSDTASATNAILLALDPDNRERIARNATVAVREEFSLGETNRRLIDILQPIYGARH